METTNFAIEIKSTEIILFLPYTHRARHCKKNTFSVH